MGSFSQGPVLDFLGFAFIIAVIGGAAFLGARYIGRFFKQQAASAREQWLFLAVFAAMYAVLYIVAYFFGIMIIPI
jgi:drug/metabolite transporter (DMT)-like permease